MMGHNRLLPVISYVKYFNFLNLLSGIVILFFLLTLPSCKSKDRVELLEIADVVTYFDNETYLVLNEERAYVENCISELDTSGVRLAEGDKLVKRSRLFRLARVGSSFKIVYKIGFNREGKAIMVGLDSHTHKEDDPLFYQVFAELLNMRIQEAEADDEACIRLFKYTLFINIVDRK